MMPTRKQISAVSILSAHGPRGGPFQTQILIRLVRSIKILFTLLRSISPIIRTALASGNTRAILICRVPCPCPLSPYSGPLQGRERKTDGRTTARGRRGRCGDVPGKAPGPGRGGVLCCLRVWPWVYVTVRLSRAGLPWGCVHTDTRYAISGNNLWGSHCLICPVGITTRTIQDGRG